MSIWVEDGTYQSADTLLESRTGCPSDSDLPVETGSPYESCSNIGCKGFEHCRRASSRQGPQQVGSSVSNIGSDRMGRPSQIKRKSLLSAPDIQLSWLTFSTHVTVSSSTSSRTMPRLASSASARQTPCHLASPRTDSAPPNPIAPPEPLPPGSTIVPKELSTTGSSSVPANRARVAPTICSWNPSGSIFVILAKYLAAE